MKVCRLAIRQSLVLVSHSGDYEVNPSAEWQPVKPIHEVLNRRSTVE